MQIFGQNGHGLWLDGLGVVIIGVSGAGIEIQTLIPDGKM